MYVLHEILHLLAPFHEVTGLFFCDVEGFAIVFLDDLAGDVIPLGLFPAAHVYWKEEESSLPMTPNVELPE